LRPALPQRVPRDGSRARHGQAAPQLLRVFLVLRGALRARARQGSRGGGEGEARGAVQEEQHAPEVSRARGRRAMGGAGMAEARFVPWTGYVEYPPEEMLRRSREFNAELQRRRTVRAFSPRPVPRAIIEQCLLAAGSAPSGAHMQPWSFVAVSDAATK